ncbi:hypothetical protein CJ195_03240 [Bacillus sp. UMB0899]|nr:hypothetical protein CJ195_03240 [Bacillus sp. UMB0899]
MKSFIRQVSRVFFSQDLSGIEPLYQYSYTMKLMIGAIMASLAAILQSAGLFVGFGYVLSMLATLPIILTTMISIRIGMMAYISTILLVSIIQPSEIIIFTFTTGLLGLCIGIGLRRFKHVLYVMVFAALSLTMGIISVMTIFHFPILGPSVSTALDSKIVGAVFVFALLYSWIWIKVSIGFSGILLKAVPHPQKASTYQKNQ